MNNENFDLVTNDENEEFTVEFGEVINDGGTHDYNELDNQPQINGHTLEGNKTNEQLGIPVYTEGTGIKLSGNTISADTDVLATKADLNSKQNVIADLPQIRSGAEAGATAVQPEDLARIATTGSYNDSLDKPSVNNVALIGNISLDALGIQPKGNYALESEIPDVSNFITNTVDNLVNYYKKSETFTKQEVNDLISAITTMDIRVVQTLPTEDISTTTIYFVPKTTAGTNDVYDEYVYVSNAWEHIGSTDIDLSGYQTKIDSSHKLSSDLVDDANQTNKFVTENEKTTWNTEIENLQEEDELLKRNLQTTTGSGEEVTLDKTAELDFVKPPLPRGNSEQEGEPSPDNEVPITNVTGNVEVTISNNDNSESKTLPVSLGNIELCKIGNYQDYLYKNNGKWYKHNAINKLVLNGSENWSISNNVFYLASISDYINSSGKICLSDKYTAINNTDIGTSAITQNNSICFFITNTNPRLYIRDERFNNVNAFKAELSENNVKVYYPTATPTDTEITDTTLISQLEEISKTLSYQGQTNITSNTIALFDVEAYQDLKIILEDIYKAFPTDTASGAVASFTDGADDLPLKSLVIDINPVQDLHGQESPYPAGGGKNKFNGTFWQGYWAYADGGWVNSNGWIATDKIPCKPSTSYTVSADAKLTRWQGFVWYDANGNYISTDNLQSNENIGLTKTSPNNAYYLVFNIAGYPTSTDPISPSEVTHFQLEEGQTATSYAPYSNICPISGYSEAKVYVSPTQDAQDATVYTIDLDGARYGGTLDVTTGVLTVNRAMVDLGAKNWYSSPAAGRTRFRTSITDIERISSPNIVAPMLCSKYPTKTANQTYQGTTGVSLQQNEADIYIYDPQKESMTTAEFKSAMSGVQLVYKLATPIEIQLAPHELNTLLGVNNIWANTGDTEVEYRADTKLYINKMIGDA